MKIEKIFSAILFSLILFFVTSPLLAQTIDPAPNPALNYRLLSLEQDELILGLSPDATLLVTGLYYSNTIRVYHVSNFTLMTEIALPESTMFPKEKKAVWSPDGSSIVFRGFQLSPTELKTFKSSCIYAINVLSGKLRLISDEKYKEKFSLNNPHVYFDPSFSSDGKSVIYHKYESNGTLVVSVDIKSRTERLLHLDPSRGNSCFAYPLSDGYLLINKDPSKINFQRALDSKKIFFHFDRVNVLSKRRCRN